MNNRNINAAAKPETIRTTLKKLCVASRRRERAHRAEAFERHFAQFTSASASVCYAAVNGVTVSVALS